MTFHAARSVRCIPPTGGRGGVKRLHSSNGSSPTRRFLRPNEMQRTCVGPRLLAPVGHPQRHSSWPSEGRQSFPARAGRAARAGRGRQQAADAQQVRARARDGQRVCHASYFCQHDRLKRGGPGENWRRKEKQKAIKRRCCTRIQAYCRQKRLLSLSKLSDSAKQSWNRRRRTCLNATRLWHQWSPGPCSSPEIGQPYSAWTLRSAQEWSVRTRNGPRSASSAFH